MRLEAVSTFRKPSNIRNMKGDRNILLIRLIFEKEKGKAVKQK
jgi:hypothetical protein